MATTPQPPEIPVRRITKIEWLEPPQPIPSPLPVPLTHSAMAVNDAKRVLIVGGYAAATGECVPSVAEFDATTRAWVNVGVPQFPYGVSEACMACVGSRFFVFGGWDGSTVRGDVHVFRPSTVSLSATTTTAITSNVPSGANPQTASTVGTDTGAASMVGGALHPNNSSGVQWECVFEGASSRWGGKKGHGADGGVEGNKAIPSRRGVRNNSRNKTFPKARRGASMVSGTLANRSVLFIFGGYDGSRRLNDLWAFDMDTYEWIEILAGPLTTKGGTRHRPSHPQANSNANSNQKDFHFRHNRQEESHASSTYCDDTSAQRSDMSLQPYYGTASTKTTPRPASTSFPSSAPSCYSSFFKGSRYLAQSLLGLQQLFSTTATAVAGNYNNTAAGAGAAGAFSASGNGTVTPMPPPSSSSTASTQSPSPQAGKRDSYVGGAGAGRIGSTTNGDGLQCAPSPRDGAAMAFDALQCRLIVYGGYSETIVGDVYELRFSPDVQILSRKRVEGGANASTEEDSNSEDDEGSDDGEESSNDEHRKGGISSARDLVVGPEHAQWRQLSTLYPPTPRYGCSLALISGVHFIVGFGVEAPSSAAWSDPSSRIGHLIGSAALGSAVAPVGGGASTPAASAGAAASGSSSPATMMLVAQQVSSGAPSPSPAKASGNGGLGGPTRLIHQLNLADLTWSIANTEGDEVIDGRAGCAAGTSLDNKKSIVLGGLTADGRYLYSGLEIEWERAEVVPLKARK